MALGKDREKLKEVVVVDLLLAWGISLGFCYLTPLFLIRIFVRQPHIKLGFALGALGIASSGVGVALASLDPHAMGAQAWVVIMLIFSALPLIPTGILCTYWPTRRKSSIVLYTVAFLLIAFLTTFMAGAFAFR